MLCTLEHMFDSQTAPTEDMPLEDTADNISSVPIEKPITEQFVPPTPNKFRQKVLKGKLKCVL